MKKYKIYVSAILALIIIFGNISKCYCVESIEVLEGLGIVHKAVLAAENIDSRRDAVSNWIHKNCESVGFLFDVASPAIPPALFYLLPVEKQNELGSNASESDILEACQEFIINNQTVNDDDTVTDNSVLKNGILNFVNNYAKNCGYYEAYAFDLRNMTNSLPTTTQYNALRELLGNSNSNIRTDYKFCVVWGSFANVAICPFEDYGLLLRSNVANWSNLNYADTNVYSYANGNTTPVNGGFQKFTWNSVSQNYIQDANPYNSQLANVRVSTRPNQSTNTNAFVLSYGEQLLPVFQTSGDATSYGVGVKPYYYNTDIWNDFSSSSGDYTIDNSNINTVTYGDTVTYIQDSYNETGNYPDNSTVNNWIDNSNQNNHNSGGGSGGDDSGGGSGSGDTNIFDWLKTLGAALGNLIKGVGEFLSEIVSGLVDAVTNLLQAISTLISGVLESLTNIFSGLIEFIYAGLPDDIKNILSLALVVAILITVLKLIRGN